MRRAIVVGSRGSKLALVQSKSVLAKLEEAYPEFQFSLTRIVTRGDRNRLILPHQAADAGIFVRELEEALLSGRIDLAVHSLKDLPTELPPELSLAAITLRLDPRDVLVSRSGKLAELVPGSRIGTGSLRRAVQLITFRPDLEVQAIRGNVDTRLRKVSCNEIDGVILAAAALIRLGREKEITEYLSLEHFLPAVGQGALVLEIRAEDEELAELSSSLNHQPTWCSVVAERAFLRGLGGGCRAPIAALGTVNGDALRLEGMVASTSGQTILRGSESGSTMTPEQVGTRLAQKMLGRGASQLIKEARAW